MRVLVAYGSKHGGTAGLAQMIAEGLCGHGVAADARAAREVWTLEPYTAVIVAGALYNSRWHRDARSFVHRYEPDAQGFPACPMARKHSGDWRDPEQVRGFVLVVLADLAAATRLAS
jgi:menaquinone-dependent protoporphyrinogen IX oxidase